MSSCSESLTIPESLTIQTVVDACGALREQLAMRQGWVADLSGITECDTAGLQLVCALGRTAREQGKGALIRPSAAIQEAARAAGVDLQTVFTQSDSAI